MLQGSTKEREKYKYIPRKIIKQIKEEPDIIQEIVSEFEPFIRRLALIEGHFSHELYEEIRSRMMYAAYCFSKKEYDRKKSIGRTISTGNEDRL